jgi:hypothetical protein
MEQREQRKPYSSVRWCNGAKDVQQYGCLEQILTLHSHAHAHAHIPTSLPHNCCGIIYGSSQLVLLRSAFN